MIEQNSVKAVYATSTPAVRVQRFKNATTSFSPPAGDDAAGKGERNNRIASMIFRHLEANGAPSYYLDTINTTDMRVREVRPFRLELVCRNLVAGSLTKRLGLEEGVRLAEPIVEVYFKNDALGDPLVNDDHVRTLQLATPSEMAELRRQTLLVNEVLIGMWRACDLELVDVTLRFGTTVDGQIVLASDLTPDEQRLWAVDDRTKDKDVYRRVLGEGTSPYGEIHDRLLRAWPSLALGELLGPPEVPR